MSRIQRTIVGRDVILCGACDGDGCDECDGMGWLAEATEARDAHLIEMREAMEELGVGA